MNDIRIYNYYNDEPLITRQTQAKDYFDKKFANIKVDVDVDLSGVNNKLDNILDTTTAVDTHISDSTNEIIEAIEESKPCLCHLATKEDVCHAKCEIIRKIESSKEEIITDIDEKFVDLNDLINK